MRDTDRQRFMRSMTWLQGKFLEMTGKEYPLPDLEYFEALMDLPIEDVEQGVRWLWRHGEFYPCVPGNLRKWVMAWREANPRPAAPAQSGIQRWEIPETPENRETGRTALQGILDALGRGESPKIYVVSDLVGEV